MDTVYWIIFLSLKNNKYITISIISYYNFLTNPSLRNLNTDFSLNICLFESVKLTKNVDQVNTNIAATA